MTGTDRAAPETAPPDLHPGFCDARDRRFLLVAAILASALGFIDSAVVSIALPAMRDGLGASLVETQWFSNAYMLPLSALILVGGSLGDRLGVARVFGAGIVLFVAASLACGLAQTPATFIAARALQGIGAALMIPGSLSLIARAYPEAERGRAIGLWASASAVTTALGPILGGAVLTWGGDGAWRWIFLINLPLGGFALWLLWRHVARDHVSDDTARIDIAGAVLITASLACLALSLAGAEHGAGMGARDVALAGVGVSLLGVFVAVERKVPSPMLPLSIFARPGFAAANAATFLIYFALAAVFFFLPMTLIAGWGHTALAATLVFAPLTVFVGLFSARVGALAARTGPARLIAAGSVLAGMGYLIMAAAAPAQAFWPGILPGAILLGAGMALVVAPLSTLVMHSAGSSSSGVASGVNNAISRLAGLFAVAALVPVAGAGYRAAGGPDSFGALSQAPGHAGAMSAAFVTIALIAALLAFAAAAIAVLALRR